MVKPEDTKYQIWESFFLMAIIIEFALVPYTSSTMQQKIY